MKTTNTFDGEQGAVVKQRVCATKERENLLAGGRGGGAVCIVPAQTRAAVEAADWLGVIAAVGGVGVFALARGAHWKGRHSGAWSVVGQFGDDGQTRSAVGAGNERVEVARVGRVEKLTAAVRAQCSVGRKQRAAGVAVARGHDGEFALMAQRRDVLGGVIDDAGKRRQFGEKLAAEGSQGVRRSFYLDEYAPLIVAAEADETRAPGDGGDKRAESDPLDDTFDTPANALNARTHPRPGRACLFHAFNFT